MKMLSILQRYVKAGGVGVISMTIDEAIAKYKEITNTDSNCPAHCNISCDKCVQESKQLAEWLEDYKRIKMLIPIEQALKTDI